MQKSHNTPAVSPEAAERLVPPTHLSAASPSFPAITMAFQPIVDTAEHKVVAYEALVRGVDGSCAVEVFNRVRADARLAFEHECRLMALRWAVKLGLKAELSLNMSPRGLTAPRVGLKDTLRAAAELGFPLNKLILEITEGEDIPDLEGFHRAMQICGKSGPKIAFDDFGAGYPTLSVLVQLWPDIVKLNGALVRSVDTDPRRLSMLMALVQGFKATDIRVIAENVETESEARALEGVGITLQQGYFFARPTVELLPLQYQAAEC